jgi:putative hydrolase of the HAD superfamily
MSVRGLLVDAAGCLITPREPVGETYARAARRQGVTLPGWRVDDAFRRVIARAEPMVFPEVPETDRPARERTWWRAIVRSTFLAADSTVRFPDPEALFGELFDHFSRGDAWALAEDARPTLVALRRRKLALGVASNFDHRLLGILEAVGISDIFDSVMIPSRCGFAKPDARFFQAAAAALGTPRAETVHVGDDPERDVAAARAAGLQSLRLRTGESSGGWPDLPARVDALATLDDRPGDCAVPAEGESTASEKSSE